MKPPRTTRPARAEAPANAHAADAPTRLQAVTLRPKANRTPGQKRWLTRQLNDPYVVAAQKAGLRSRAAFKLTELDDRFGLIRPGCRIVDLGAAPGGWTQVARRRRAGPVVAIDLLPMDPVEGASVLVGDFREDAAVAAILAALGGAPDLVLSDMAPNTTGHAATDHIRIMALAELAADFAIRTLSEGGSFVAKVFQGGSERAMLDALKRHFAQVRHAKPAASRKESSELYVVGTGFKRRPQGVEAGDQRERAAP